MADENNKESLQESTQINKQELDQLQFNNQQFHITMADRTKGKIIGSVYLSKEKLLLEGVEVRLFFGDITDKPLMKAVTAEDGSYEFTNLPSGFYSIVAQYKNLDYNFRYIQLDIGETLYKPIPIN